LLTGERPWQKEKNIRSAVTSKKFPLGDDWDKTLELKWEKNTICDEIKDLIV